MTHHHKPVMYLRGIIGVVTIGAWVPRHPHFLSVMVPGTASKFGHPGCRAPGTPTFEILSTPLRGIMPGMHGGRLFQPWLCLGLGNIALPCLSMQSLCLISLRRRIHCVLKPESGGVTKTFHKFMPFAQCITSIANST
jgi:hypothetical protein